MGENVEERRCRASSIPSLLRPVKSVSWPELFTTVGRVFQPVLPQLVPKLEPGNEGWEKRPPVVFCGIQVSMAGPARVAFTIYSELPSYAAHMQTRQWLQMT